jgi:hypothetical protein
MIRTIGKLTTILIVMTLASGMLLAQGRGGFGSQPTPISRAVNAGPGPVTTFGYATPVYSGFCPSYGGYGGAYSPFLESSSSQAPYPYMPKFWWVGPYGIDDPRQDGYNPNAGYAWDSVGTLLLSTLPAKARVKLDGISIGAASYLGPIQLPAGDHTLRIEAAGYEPSETVLGVDSPVAQELEVRLSPLASETKPVTPQ